MFLFTPKRNKLHLTTITLFKANFFWVWKNFIHIKKKLCKKDKAGTETKYITKKIYIYNYVQL